MAFWNRNKTDNSNLPAEYAQYYDSQSQQAGNRSKAMNLFISIATLLITIALVLALFFGIRALYRRSQANKDNKKPVVTRPIAPSTPTTPPNTPSTPPSGSSTTPPSPTPAPTTPPSGSTPSSTPGSGSSVPGTGVTTVPSTGIDE